MITACTQGPKWFHVLKVIDRKPKGKTLHYKNVLANTATSRWITQTNPADSLTRTRDGYTIKQDIDVEVAELEQAIKEKERWASRTTAKTITVSAMDTGGTTLNEDERSGRRAPRVSRSSFCIFPFLLFDR